jgi:hypothetical protein
MDIEKISIRILDLVAKMNNIPYDEAAWWNDIYHNDLVEVLPHLFKDWNITDFDDTLCHHIAEGDETLLFDLYGHSEWWWKTNEIIDEYFNRL